MGIMKKRKQNKKIKFNDDGTIEDEAQDDGYDIEASDNEINDIPSKWYDEVSNIKVSLLSIVVQ